MKNLRDIVIKTDLLAVSAIPKISASLAMVWTSSKNYMNRELPIKNFVQLFLFPSERACPVNCQMSKKKRTDVTYL